MFKRKCYNVAFKLLAVNCIEKNSTEASARATCVNRGRFQIEAGSNRAGKEIQAQKEIEAEASIRGYMIFILYYNSH